MPKPSSKFNDKLRDIHKALLAAHRESAGYSSSITGDEREAINRHLLSTILPTNHRCGSGTIIDAYGHDSGQVDGIIELPYSLSFPLATAGPGAGNRLYLAETVGIAFEYKSDLSAQAKDAIAKVKKIKTLERYALDPYEITTPSYRVQTFIVAFAGGRSNRDALEKKFLNPRDPGAADGVLLVEKEMFIGRTVGGKHYYAKGAEQSVFAFLACLSSTLQSLADEKSSFDDYVEAVKEPKKLQPSVKQPAAKKTAVKRAKPKQR